MAKLARFLQQSAMAASHRTALRDRDLIQAIQSELKYEKSSNPFQFPQGQPERCSLGDFVMDWDAHQYQDVVLRKRYDHREEIAVSAVLGPIEDGSLPRKVLMKICIAKPGLSSVLQFDCRVFGDDYGSDFSINNAYYLRSRGSVVASDYKGPLFRSLDPQLQEAFKASLIAKGVNQELTNFLLLHLHKKEQDQYIDWLHKLELIVAKNAE